MTARIVVADDEADIRRLTTFTLRRRGYTVLEAVDGDTALDLIRAERPDAAVLDVMMPGLSGMELLRRTRSDPALARTAVVLLTARADAAQRVEALRAGAADYVLKPFDPPELLARVDNALGTRTR